MRLLAVSILLKILPIILLQPSWFVYVKLTVISFVSYNCHIMYILLTPLKNHNCCIFEGDTFWKKQ